ncbi:MAG: hypothetical protein WC498_04200 [Candidatus Saccharimonadales bacterium]
MNKRRLHHAWTKFRKIHPWYFLVIAIISSAFCLVSLRRNNEHMVVLRDAVYAADKNAGDVEGALQNLRHYVYSHMNTGLASGSNAVHPPIQLKYTYDRLVAAQPKQTATNGVQFAPIPDALYKFDFTAAKWSPDTAGWTMVIAVVSIILFLASAVYHWWIKRYLL